MSARKIDYFLVFLKSLVDDIYYLLYFVTNFYDDRIHFAIKKWKKINKNDTINPSRRISNIY